MEDINVYLDEASELMDKSVDHLKKELAKINPGKASPEMVSGVMVEYYGTPTPLQQVANVSASDAKTLVIQPWEKSMLGPIEKAIFEANLGLTPQNDGEVIRLNIPPLTEERRRDLVKKAKVLGEDAKVSVRNARRDAMEAIKKEIKDGYPEDAGKRLEADVQDNTDKHIKLIDDLIAAKEKAVMTV